MDLILDSYSGKSILEKHGVRICPQKLVKSEKDARYAAESLCNHSDSVVMKISANKIVHKSEMGLIIKGVVKEKTPAAFRKIMFNAKNAGLTLMEINGVIVQKIVDGNELIVSVKLDKQFGPVLVVGAGGILTEIYKDAQIAICPCSRQHMLKMIQQLKIWPVLNGSRGVKSNVNEIIKVMMGLQRIIMSTKSNKYKSDKSNIFNEIEINPLIVKEKAYAVDIRISLMRNK